MFINGTWSPFYKVPASRIYFYKDENAGVLNLRVLNDRVITANSNAIYRNDLLGGDTSSPFTLIISNGDLEMENSFTNKNAMFIVKNGKTLFKNTDCNVQDEVVGIFISKDGFVSKADKNTDPNKNIRCDGGSLYIRGVLVGSGINETFFDSRRSTFDSWSHDADLFFDTTLNTGTNTNLVRKAGTLFRVIYLPSVVNEESAPLTLTSSDGVSII